MTHRSVQHSTFNLERRYDISAVLAAWPDSKAKAQRFAGPAEERSPDFRVDGRESVRGHQGNGSTLTFESVNRGTVNMGRVVYSFTLFAGETVVRVSVATVEFSPDDRSFRLVLTEPDASVVGQGQASRGSKGTANWVEVLAAELEKQHSG